jgi:transposase
LPAYAQDGIVLSRIFRGSTDAAVFEDFIAQLLQHCGRWPEPKSALVMDNASFHHSESIAQMCTEAGMKLVYLPPYSPDLNPIEEFFAKLKVSSYVIRPITKRIPIKVSMFSSDGVSIWSAQGKKVLRAIFVIQV